MKRRIVLVGVVPLVGLALGGAAQAETAVANNRAAANSSDCAAVTSTPTAAVTELPVKVSVQATRSDKTVQYRIAAENRGKRPVSDVVVTARIVCATENPVILTAPSADQGEISGVGDLIVWTLDLAGRSASAAVADFSAPAPGGRQVAAVSAADSNCPADRALDPACIAAVDIEPSATPTPTPTSTPTPSSTSPKPKPTPTKPAPARP
ncbi:hypothetical protein, partial [Actinocorallia lasiicapitis]